VELVMESSGFKVTYGGQEIPCDCVELVMESSGFKVTYGGQ
jgi:hypothetical protein